MNATAVIIARFQTPYLHEGHHYLIRTISSKHNKVVVLLGVAPLKGSKRNPFDFYTRERLLKAAYPTLIVLPLHDHPSDAAWSEALDRLLKATFPQEGFVLYGSRDSFAPYYTGSLPVKELPQWGNHSATAIRQEMADKVLDSPDFRLGINYAFNNTYPKVLPTVDIALFKENGTKILLGKKPNRNGWRLPGGYVDPADENLETAARRELQEECGLLEIAHLSYIGSARIDDWRYRNEEDQIMTTLFTAHLVYGNPVAGDDLEEVAWFAVPELERLLQTAAIVPEHQVLIRMLSAPIAMNATQDPNTLINLKNEQHENN